MQSRLTKAGKQFAAAYAEELAKRAAREPKRIYLGGGIWWTPSAFRRALAKEGK